MIDKLTVSQCLCRFDLRQGTKLISIFYFCFAFVYMIAMLVSSAPLWFDWLMACLAIVDVAYAFWLWYATEKRNVYWIKIWLLLDVLVLLAYWSFVLWLMAELGIIQVWRMDVYELASVAMVVFFIEVPCFLALFYFWVVVNSYHAKLIACLRHKTTVHRLVTKALMRSNSADPDFMSKQIPMFVPQEVTATNASNYLSPSVGNHVARVSLHGGEKQLQQVNHVAVEHNHQHHNHVHNKVNHLEKPAEKTNRSLSLPQSMLMLKRHSFPKVVTSTTTSTTSSAPVPLRPVTVRRPSVALADPAAIIGVPGVASIGSRHRHHHHQKYQTPLATVQESSTTPTTTMTTKEGEEAETSFTTKPFKAPFDVPTFYLETPRSQDDQDTSNNHHHHHRKERRANSVSIPKREHHLTRNISVPLVITSNYSEEEEEKDNADTLDEI